MEKVKIADVCKISNGFAFKSDKYVSTNGGRVIRITNVQKGKIVDNAPKLYPFSELENLENYKIDEGDIMMSLTGNVGRVGKFPKELLPAYINQRVCRIKTNSSRLIDDYLFHFLNSNKFENDAVRNSAGAAQLNLSTNWLADYEIPLPSIQTQQKIAAILDKADELRQYNKQLIEKYDTLTQSLFLEMFGDPVKNEKEWEIKELHLVALISSGITKGRKNNIVDSIGELPYMRVANVQDGYFDLTEIKTIPAFKTDLEKFLLKKGDVLMTEGGDPDKLGRGAVWQDEVEQCLHQNHIFKVRVDSTVLTPLYFNKLTSSLYGKKYFLKIAKQTTGIATINKTQLSKFPVLMASISLQNQFEEQVQLIETQKQQAQEALAKSEDLFQSLLQRAFKGELN
jgi:type I restriction enzyme S subunit